MSFKLRLDPKSQAATQLITAVQRALLSVALAERESSGLTKRKLAEKLGIDRSRVTRLLNGAANLTLRSLAELAWAMGYEAKIVFEKVDESAGVVAPPVPCQILNLNSGRVLATDALTIDLEPVTALTSYFEAANTNYAPVEAAA